MASLVLASRSEARLRLLRAAGISVVAHPTAVDEAAIKDELRRAGASASDVAVALAIAKARAAGPDNRLVLAADQMLEHDGHWLSKPRDRAAAREQLMRLSGATHRLVVGAVFFLEGAEIWRVATEARLTMRSMTEAEIAAYLDQVGDDALRSVGAYQIEGVGVRLFSAIDGDLFTIQGLPLLEISAFLHARGVGFKS